MKKYPESKLVGTPTKRKGVWQLVKAIENLKTKPTAFLPPCLAKVNKIIPLIVTKDEIGSSFFINTYLNERFESQFKRKDYRPLVITPLVTMSAGSMERAMRPLAKMAFGTILENRITADRQLGYPFEAASKYVFTGTSRSLPKHIELLTGALDGLMKDFGMKEEDGSPAKMTPEQYGQVGQCLGMRFCGSRFADPGKRPVLRGQHEAGFAAAEILIRHPDPAMAVRARRDRFRGLSCLTARS